MLEQEPDDRLLVGVVGGIQAELLEALVLAHQVGDGTVEQVDDFLERRPGRMLLQIFNDVELDIARAEQLERAARVPSAGVVIQGDAFHRVLVFLTAREKDSRQVRALSFNPEPSPDLYHRITGAG